MVGHGVANCADAQFTRTHLGARGHAGLGSVGARSPRKISGLLRLFLVHSRQ